MTMETVPVVLFSLIALGVMLYFLLRSPKLKMELAVPATVKEIHEAIRPYFRGNFTLEHLELPFGPEFRQPAETWLIYEITPRHRLGVDCPKKEILIAFSWEYTTWVWSVRRNDPDLIRIVNTFATDLRQERKINLRIELPSEAKAAA